MSNKQPLLAAFEELADAAVDVQNSDHKAFPGSIKRFSSLLTPTLPLGKLVDDTLPTVDFDTWYAEAMSTFRGAVGSGTLDWPVERPERVALQLTLIRRIADNQINLGVFVAKFFGVDKYLDSDVRAFVQHIFQPFYRHFSRIIEPHVRRLAPATDPVQQVTSHASFVDIGRINALRHIQSPQYDLQKLVQLCEELNICYANSCFLAVAALTRSLLDHVPPIFGMKTFAEVANNYPGTKSFRESMQHLAGSARKIGDAHLHTQIRQRESLPNATQVNFSNDLDVLLSEISRLLP